MDKFKIGDTVWIAYINPSDGNFYVTKHLLVAITTQNKFVALCKDQGSEFYDTTSLVTEERIFPTEDSAIRNYRRHLSEKISDCQRKINKYSKALSKLVDNVNEIDEYELAKEIDGDEAEYFVAPQKPNIAKKEPVVLHPAWPDTEYHPDRPLGGTAALEGSGSVERQRDFDREQARKAALDPVWRTVGDFLFD